MGVGFERGLPHLRQQVGERRVAGELAAQRQGVGEEADHVLDLDPVAVGDRRADHQVVVAGQAREQRLEGGEEGHEQGRRARPAELIEAARERRRQEGDELGALEALHRRARPVERQVEHGRHPGEALPPVGELLFEDLAGEPAPLPDREVGVLDRQLRQLRPAPGEERLVDQAELVGEHADRPAVGDHVVDDYHRDVALLLGAHEEGAQQRPAGEVERAGDLDIDQLLGSELAPRRRQRAQVDDRERHARRGRDDLHRPVVHHGEAGAQALVPRHLDLQGGGEERPAHLAAQPDHQRHVVGAGARVELVEEPQPLLGEGEGQRAVARHRHERRRLAPAVAAQERLDLRRQRADRGALEPLKKTAQRQLDAEGDAHARGDLGGEERMAA